MLSETSVKKLQPRPSAYRVFDGALRGFGIKVSAGGVKTWFIRYREAGRERYLSLGHWPHTPLSAARDKARAALSRMDQGLSATPNTPSTDATLSVLLEAWLAHQRRQGRRTVDEAERAIRHNVPAALLDKPANQVTPADIRDVLAAVHRRGARVQANRLRSALHTLYRYALQADHDPTRLGEAQWFGVTVNPVSAVPRDAGAERVGERVLSWSEIREVWDTDDLSWPARQAVRLLLISGQRVNEVVQAQWDEFDLDAGVWAIPAARYKGKRPHTVPITPLMRTLLNELQAVYPGPVLFPARNLVGSETPWGDTALGHAVHDYSRADKRTPWQARDLRRTWKTLAGEAGLSLEIRNRIQGHQFADVGSRHYDKHSYLPEKRRALEQWERALAAKLAGDNVLAFRKQA